MDMTVDAETAEQLARRWWWFLAAGIVTGLIGVLVLFRPIAGVFGLALLIATGLIVSGISELASIPSWDSPWVPAVFGGLSLVAGIATVAWPDITLWILTVLIGLSLLLRGALRVVGSLVTRPPWWGGYLAVGVVEAGLGIAALAWPTATLTVLALIMGINLILVGSAQITFGLAAKRLGEGGGGGPSAAVA
jgi:uncharacterized membrane protein HdeD (DUF308 family)